MFKRPCNATFPLIVAFLVTLAAASAHAVGRNALQTAKPAATATPQTNIVSAVQAIAAKVQSLSLKARIAQLMLVRLFGVTTPNTEDIQFLVHYTPGGVIVPSALRPSAATEYIAALRTLPVERQKGIPLFIAANLYTLEQPGQTTFFTELPSLLSIAAANDPGATQQLGSFMANSLRVMGFNMHLGPSLDLAPILPGARGSLQSLGSNPQFAARAGATIIHSLNENGVIAVPMGFPGGGLNRLPKKPAVLLTPKSTLAQNDLLPYQRAIAAGAAVIHVGATRVPQFEPDKRPACLSAVVMRDLLRKQMGFKGVILVGPLDSLDVSELVDPQQAAVQAINAGADMILWNEDGSRVVRTIEKIAIAVKAGIISQDTIDTACARVLALKEKFRLGAQPLPTDRDAAKLERDRAYPKEAYQIERRAITLVKDKGGILPLSKQHSPPIGVTGIIGVEELRNALAKHLKPVFMQPIVSAKYVGDIEDFEIDRILNTVAGIRTTICIFNNAPGNRGQAQLVRALKAKGKRVVVVLLGYPRALPDIADADAILLAYTKGPRITETIRAIADALLGRSAVGILPNVHNLTTVVGRTESFNATNLLHSPAGLLPVTIKDPFVAGYAVSYPIATLKPKVVWDFGDGKHAKGFEVKHAYKKAGRYHVTLSVKDKQGEKVSRTFQAVVK